MRIILASDHAGMNLKNLLVQYVKSLAIFEVVDLGTNTKNSCHYPQFAKKMSEIFKPQDRGILICGSGIGIGISATKCNLPCSVAYNQYTAAQCGKHFKVMSMGERVVTIQIAKLMVHEFLVASKALKQ